MLIVSVVPEHSAQSATLYYISSSTSQREVLLRVKYIV